MLTKGYRHGPIICEDSCGGAVFLWYVCQMYQEAFLLNDITTENVGSISLAYEIGARKQIRTQHAWQAAAVSQIQ